MPLQCLEAICCNNIAQNWKRIAVEVTVIGETAGEIMRIGQIYGKVVAMQTSYRNQHEWLHLH